MDGTSPFEYVSFVGTIVMDVGTLGDWRFWQPADTDGKDFLHWGITSGRD